MNTEKVMAIADAATYGEGAYIDASDFARKLEREPRVVLDGHFTVRELRDLIAALEEND